MPFLYSRIKYKSTTKTCHGPQSSAPPAPGLSARDLQPIPKIQKGGGGTTTTRASQRSPTNRLRPTNNPRARRSPHRLARLPGKERCASRGRPKRSKKKKDATAARASKASTPAASDSESTSSRSSVRTKSQLQQEGPLPR